MFICVPVQSVRGSLLTDQPAAGLQETDKTQGEGSMSSADVALEFREEYQDGLDPQMVLKRLGNVFGLGQPGLSEALSRPVTVLREQLSVEEAER